MIGDSFTFLNYTSLTGEFSHIQNPIFNNGTERWVVSYGATNAVLTATANTPDQASTLLLLTMSLVGLLTYSRRFSSKNSGAVVSISATPTNNPSVSYNFTGWTGTGTGSYSGTNNPGSITMNGPITETASFTHN